MTRRRFNADGTIEGERLQLESNCRLHDLSAALATGISGATVMRSLP